MNEHSKVVYPVVLLDIDKLIPNNLYLNDDKIEALLTIPEADFDDSVPPVLVSRIEGEYSLLDGHSRAFVAMKLGKTKVRTIVQPLDVIGMEHLFKRIHSDAKALKITSVRDLENRILYGKEHEEKWIGYCKKVLAELEANESFRS